MANPELQAIIDREKRLKQIQQDFSDFRKQIKDEYSEFRKEGRKQIEAGNKTKGQISAAFSDFRKAGRDAIAEGQKQMKEAKNKADSQKGFLRNLFSQFRKEGRQLLRKGAGAGTSSKGVVEIDVGPKLIRDVKKPVNKSTGWDGTPWKTSRKLSRKSAVGPRRTLTHPRLVTIYLVPNVQEGPYKLVFARLRKQKKNTRRKRRTRPATHVN